MPLKQILRALRHHEATVKARYRVKELGLFGSFVRGEETATSDVDILVDFDTSATLFDLVGLALYLEDALACKVDVVPKRALRPELRAAVLREVVLI